MSEPVVRTFPAYAFGLLRLAAAERGEPAPRLLTGSEQDAVIREMLDAPDAADRWPSSLRQAVRTRAFAAELRDLLLRAAERGIGPRTLADLGRRHGRAGLGGRRGLPERVRAACSRCATRRPAAASPTTRPSWSGRRRALLVDDPALLAAERDRCRHVYVDELADTDPAQIDLLGLIAGGGGHVVAFADPDSSTFALPRRLTRPGCATSPTGSRTADGRRGAADHPATSATGRHPELVAATRRVAARLRGPVRHRAIGAGGPRADERRTAGLPALEVCTLRSATSESAYVAHRLREAHLHHGVPWSRMAVIVRSLQHHHAGAAAGADPGRRAGHDRRRGHRAGHAAGGGAAAAAAALRAAMSPLLDEEAAVTLLHSPLGGADPFAERRLRQGLREARARRPAIARPSGELLVEALREPGASWRWSDRALDPAGAAPSPA